MSKHEISIAYVDTKRYRYDGVAFRIIYLLHPHYNDVIMGAIASQITSLTIVYSIVNSDADQRKYQSSASLAFVRGNLPGTGEFPAQMASYAENVSIWWRLHDRPPMNSRPAMRGLDIFCLNKLFNKLSRCRGFERPLSSCDHTRMCSCEDTVM